MPKCDYCNEKSVECVTVRQGHVPEDAKKENTMQDHRRVVVVRVCAGHLGRIPRAGT